jgi:hypothetical protein
MAWHEIAAWIAVAWLVWDSWRFKPAVAHAIEDLENRVEELEARVIGNDVDEDEDEEEAEDLADDDGEDDDEDDGEKVA